jgi:RNase P/RNase MRP subunit POP5
MAAPHVPQKWEYIVVQYVGSIWSSNGEWDRPELKNLTTEQMLNHFGALGWELIKIGPVHDTSGAPSAAYIFKRQVT